MHENKSQSEKKKKKPKTSKCIMKPTQHQANAELAEHFSRSGPNKNDKGQRAKSQKSKHKWRKKKKKHRGRGLNSELKIHVLGLERGLSC